jgi:hypothetical protein
MSFLLYFPAHIVQTALDNEGSIGDIGEAVQKTADLLARSMANLSSSVSPELQSRIASHTSYALVLFLCSGGS